MDIKVAAGMFIVRNDDKILIGHPTNHKKNFWSIPKGLVEDGEDLLVAAKRETYEETNILLYCGSDDVFHKLPSQVYKKKNKVLVPFVFFERENKLNLQIQDIKCTSMVSHPKGDFPEMDEFMWATLEEASELVHESQVRCLDELRKLI